MTEEEALDRVVLMLIQCGREVQAEALDLSLFAAQGATLEEKGACCSVTELPRMEAVRRDECGCLFACPEHNQPRL